MGEALAELSNSFGVNSFSEKYVALAPLEKRYRAEQTSQPRNSLKHTGILFVIQSKDFAGPLAGDKGKGIGREDEIARPIAREHRARLERKLPGRLIEIKDGE